MMGEGYVLVWFDELLYYQLERIDKELEVLRELLERKQKQLRRYDLTNDDEEFLFGLLEDCFTELYSTCEFLDYYSTQKIRKMKK